MIDSALKSGPKLLNGFDTITSQESFQLQQVSRKDLLKCFKQEAELIEHEFALLQRKDFFDFIKHFGTDEASHKPYITQKDMKKMPMYFISAQLTAKAKVDILNREGAPPAEADQIPTDSAAGARNRKPLETVTSEQNKLYVDCKTAKPATSGLEKAPLDMSPPGSPGSQCTEEATLKSGLREHLALTTDAILDEVMNMLRNETKQSLLMQGVGQPQPCANKLMAVPTFDASVNYIQKVREQADVLEKVQSLYEDHSTDYLNMLKDVVHSSEKLMKRTRHSAPKSLPAHQLSHQQQHPLQMQM